MIILLVVNVPFTFATPRNRVHIKPMIVTLGWSTKDLSMTRCFRITSTRLAVFQRRGREGVVISDYYDGDGNVVVYPETIYSKLFSLLI